MVGVGMMLVGESDDVVVEGEEKKEVDWGDWSLLRC